MTRGVFLCTLPPIIKLTFQKNHQGVICMNVKISKVALMVAATTLGVACNNQSQPKGENLIVSQAAMSYAVASKGEVEVGSVYYSTTNGLSVRNGASSSSTRKGSLSRNDRVRVVGLGVEGSDYVQIEVVKTWNQILTSEKYFVSYKYLAAKRIDYKDYDSKYFVIQNLATERMRVYEKSCEENNVCYNKLVMEAEIAIGEDKKETQTYVGSYRVTDWIKFYQDGARHYPSWYDPNFPETPDPGSSFSRWFKKKYMPKVSVTNPKTGKTKRKKIGSMRGAFGWYTAKVGPNHYSQWTHGTIGWGEDKDKFIKKTKSWLANVFANPRSSGCSRNNNEAIAYLRQLIDVGTPIIKIYAKEALLDQDRVRYNEKSKDWEYILTKNGVRRDGQKSDKYEVLAAGTPSDEFLEEGVYSVDTYPNVVYYTPASELSGQKRKVGDRGNTYAVKNKNMKGLFYVDAGLISADYAHPGKIGKGGFRSELAPEYAKVQEAHNLGNASRIDSEVEVGDDHLVK